MASLIIWILGYFPRNEAALKSFDEQKTQIGMQYDLKISDQQVNQEKIKILEQEKEIAITAINTKKESKRQEMSFIGMIGRFVEPVMRPLGFDWKMSVSLIAGAAAKEIVVSTMGVLYESEGENDDSTLIDRIRKQEYTSGPKKGEKVFSPLVAFSFMIFVLIYFPCVAVIAAVKKESGKWKWALFVAVYTTGLAWIMSFLVYQVGGLFI